MLITEILKKKEEYKEEIKRMQKMEFPIILFGAGKTKEYNLQFFHKLGISPVAFCDNAPEKQGKIVGNIPILSLEQVRQQYPTAYFYITTQMFYTEIRQQLLNAGCEEEKISEYDIVFQLQWEENCMNYYKQHEAQVDWLYENLADEESRKVLKNRLLFLRTRNRNYMLEVRRTHQYFEEELVDFSKIKCYVDLGMYTGDTIMEFLKIVGKQYKSIYGFEPDAEIFQIAQDNLKPYDNIIFAPLATSDYDGVTKVEQSLGVMQTIADGIFSSNADGENVFRVCRLDTYFKGSSEKIDMLKMDIEGAEHATLSGAQERIISDKPVLAVCVYHKQEDILELPLLCKEWVPGYRIYLRHYSDNQTETVCYMVSNQEGKNE